jgi:hypothetical protein
MEFINNYFWIAVIFILVWFKIDCRKYNRFVVDKFEVFMYYIFSYFTVLHFMTNGIFRG